MNFNIPYKIIQNISIGKNDTTNIDSNIPIIIKPPLINPPILEKNYLMVQNF